MAALRATTEAFGRVLETREARRILAAGLVGRQREAGTSLALILAVRGDRGSFAAAGVASAVYLAAGALTRPVHGRWVDRAGPRVPLLVGSALNALALAAVAMAAWRGAPGWALIGLCGVVGVTLPALSATLRALWPWLAPGAGEHAYALDTFSYEISLVSGPALVGGIAAVSSPSVALVAIAGLGILGTTAVATAPCARSRGGANIRRGTRLRVSRTVGLLIALSLFVGAAEGAMTILATGVASARHAHAASGPLLSCLAVGSLVGVVAYGSLGESGAPARRLIVAAAGMVVAGGLLAVVGDSLVGFALGAGAVGLTLAPTLTMGFIAIRHAAPPGGLAETFTWASFAASAGAAGSQALAGTLIAGHGISTASWLVPALASAALLTAVCASSGT